MLLSPLLRQIALTFQELFLETGMERGVIGRTVGVEARRFYQKFMRERVG
jgi:hypothetical protein